MSKRIVSPLKQHELEEALRLLRRPQGATTKDLMKPARTAQCDAVWKLRGYLKRYYPKLTIISEPMDTARRDREGIFSGGRTRVYHVEENKDVQMKTAWQIDDQGNHRVVVNGTAGEWAGYNHVSRLTVGTDVYVGFSSFWEGALPVEQVLKLQKVHAINEILQGTRPEKI